MDILFEDNNIVVCIKPVGMDSEKDVPTALGGEIFTLHRLDKNVSGVMIYARNKSAAASFSKEIQAGRVVKEYVAMVEGTPPPEGEWEDLLFKDSAKNKVYVVKRPRSGVKKAKLSFKRLTEGEYSLVRVRLFTGRSHQIRVQFSSRGYPLVGDHKYGSRSEETAPMLFSCCLRFFYDGQEREFSALPEWAKIAEF